MAKTISASVGFSGTNGRFDVKTIQDLLNRVPVKTGGPVPPLIVDGICGPLVIAAIRKFQQSSRRPVDGRVDPGGQTLGALNGFDGEQAATLPIQHLQHAALANIRISARVSTYVAMPDPKYAPAVGASSRKKLPPGLLSWFVGKLKALDKALKGNARQSWGVIIYGSGTGSDSAATKLSKDATIWNASVDYAKLMEYMELIFVAIPEGTSYRDTVEHMRDALKARDPEKAATVVFENVEKIEKLVKELESPHGEANPGGPAEVRPAKVAVGQWVAYDASGNEYVMIKYSDGSKRFVFGSIYGVKDIPDPGPMVWKRVP